MKRETHGAFHSEVLPTENGRPHDNEVFNALFSAERLQADTFGDIDKFVPRKFVAEMGMALFMALSCNDKIYTYPSMGVHVSGESSSRDEHSIVGSETAGPDMTYLSAVSNVI